MKQNNMLVDYMKPKRVLGPSIVILLVLTVLFFYTFSQRRNVVRNVEQVANQMTENIAENIANEIDYGKSSIKLSAVTIAQTMTSGVISNPTEVILPMVENTPFGAIEYIRADGMNIMNIGEPFDASDRVYYIEGIKGNTGIWNNFHPKTSRETLVNFYTPIIYDGEISGVITGYIEATSQISALFERKLYGKDVYGILVDENNMVICSTIQSEYVPDLTLDMFINNFNATSQQKAGISEKIKNASSVPVSYKDANGEGRICVTIIPSTQWKVITIVPASSFNEIISDNTRDFVVAISCVSLILIIYAAHVLLRNVRRRRAMAKENARLEEENRVFNEENQRTIAEISEIRDIIASASMGTWRIELIEGQEPRMFVDSTMEKLLGISGQGRTPEMIYKDWFENITPEAVDSVLRSVERMEQGFFDENTYLWNHPQKGIRYVRCGGTSQEIQGGYVLRGYHYDVDEVVREDQEKVTMLKEALEEKNEYYSTLETLGDIFYSMHVIDLVEDTAVEFNAKDVVKQIVNHKNGAVNMMYQVMNQVSVDEWKEAALEFTNLTTLPDRMKNKKIISKEFVGRDTGWYKASFIAMESDETGKPTKVIFTTRVIDEEKKQEERLIKKSQTDELTGLLNRRAYEEDIYEHNDVPIEENFIYVSLDVNGLKIVNDTKGHMAGDELIIGACQCMKNALGPYGKLYRIGGDEFVAILFCEVNKVASILKNFDAIMAGWSGKLIDTLSISYGWISKEEDLSLSVRQLGAVAEQRMYDNKSFHYKKMGVDRRGQQDAHKALCALYTKILKINISEDSFQIVNVDEGEQSVEKGFSDKISEWLKDFGKSGYVHPEDLEEYLKVTDIQYMRVYFAENKTSLNVLYRRKYENGFKQVMMEIIPANDYSDDNQTLFLYVKDIDK